MNENKKMSLSLIEDELNVNEMVEIQGSAAATASAASPSCSFVTGGLCAATFIFAFSGVFAPLAAATGAGCVTGLLGCN